MQRNPSDSLVPAVAALIGLAFVGIGAWHLTNLSQTFFGEGGTDAQVVELLRVPLRGGTAQATDGGRRQGYVPVIQWRTPDGQVHRMTAGAPADPPRFAKGETVRVVYDPIRPYDAQIHRLGPALVGPLMTTVAGLLLVLVAALRRRRARRS